MSLPVCLLAAASLHAATVQVTSTADSGAGSLRAAIAAAQPGDTISFGVTGTITLISQLIINKSLTIAGPGAANLSISGNHLDRVLYVDNGGVASVTGLTIRDGAVSGFGGGVYIFNGGKAEFTNVSFSGNSATEGGGAAINVGGIGVFTNCKFLGNTATVSGFGGGGAIRNRGTATISNSTISGNTASGLDAQGGGIFNDLTLKLTGSTVSGNTVSAYRTGLGGGISNQQAVGTSSLTATNNTIVGNIVSGGTEAYGGGLYNGAALYLVNSTLSGNSAPQGGNLYVSRFGAQVKNTILASGSGGNCGLSASVHFTSLGYNLSDDATCIDLSAAAGDQINVPSGLDANGLSQNGGPTATIALLLSSTAVDAVPLASCTGADGVTPVAVDQRGVLRPRGAACDIGSFELGNSQEYLISGIADTLKSFNLSSGMATSLNTKLSGALSGLTAACTDLKTLATEIKAQSGKQLTVEQATELLNQIGLAMTALGCQ